MRAFDKRKVDTVDLERIASEIEQTVQNSLEREISTEQLGEMGWSGSSPWMRWRICIRFASIYHRFQNASSFMREISRYLEEK